MILKGQCNIPVELTPSIYLVVSVYTLILIIFIFLIFIKRTLAPTDVTTDTNLIMLIHIPTKWKHAFISPIRKIYLSVTRVFAELSVQLCVR